MRTQSLVGIWLLASLVLVARPADADGVADEDMWRYRNSRIAIDAGLLAALPVALETGLAKGFGAGLTLGDLLHVGIRASWATATESTVDWSVNHDDLRLMLSGGARAHAGRGSFGVRIGLGGALVHETRTRVGGSVAGSQGMLRETTANALHPIAEVEAVLALHVTGGWLLLLAGGPSLARVERELRTGWTSQLGIGWQL